ncbi:MAG: ferrous iron transport protein B [Butyrivibrio sp.]|nr:ferrous iron transport protein B [Butyrivibrio sp.]
MTLKELPISKAATVISVGGEGVLRQHFLDMGIIPGADIAMVKFAPMGDPVEVRVHSFELTLRLSDAEKIEIDNVRDYEETASNPEKKKIHTKHPCIGEDKNPLPKNISSRKLNFALAGNQNCGKTTLFNCLTGSNQHVGNFPGVTVDRKDGTIKGYKGSLVTDLPGIYSMSPYTSEEIVTREFLLTSELDGIINIVDATNIERNLYLTMQLLELNIPMVLALNMMDEVRENGGAIDVNELENMLGIPVVPISAAKNEGIEELIEHAMYVAAYKVVPAKQDFCSMEDNGGAVHRCLHGIMHIIEDHAEKSNISVRFASSKLAEGDPLIVGRLELDDNETETIEHIVCQMEKERGLDRSAAIADMRFSYINRICRKTVIKPRMSKEHIRSEKIDRILTGKYTAIPSFIIIMASIFVLTFNTFGAWISDLLDRGINAAVNGLDILLTNAGVNAVLKSLVTDGICTGVGSVLSFLPIIILLFLFMSLLEDSGYMARIAFVMDKPLRKIGLSGRSIVPMLLGFGCTVPGVMASRTLPSARDRKMTIMLTPFMSCSAKLPVYAFLAHAFFPGYGALAMVAMYFGGIFVGILVAIVMRYTKFRGEAVPFVMELPNYRLPGIKSVAHLLWDKAKDFLQKAFTIIFIASMIIWFLQTFNTSFALVSNSQDSILAVLADKIAPVFAPLGFGTWQICVALITGFMAKESVVSTLTVLYGGSAALCAAISPSAGLALMVFCLLYSPCVAAIAAVRRELGWRWATMMVLLQCVIAWTCAFVVYRISILIR